MEYSVNDFLANFGKEVRFELMRITSTDITTAELVRYKGYGKIVGIKENEVLVVGKAGYGEFLTNFHDWIPNTIVTEIVTDTK